MDTFLCLDKGLDFHQSPSYHHVLVLFFRVITASSTCTEFIKIGKAIKPHLTSLGRTTSFRYKAQISEMHFLRCLALYEYFSSSFIQEYALR